MCIAKRLEKLTGTASILCQESKFIHGLHPWQALRAQIELVSNPFPVHYYLWIHHLWSWLDGNPRQLDSFWSGPATRCVRWRTELVFPLVLLLRDTGTLCGNSVPPCNLPFFQLWLCLPGHNDCHQHIFGHFCSLPPPMADYS